MKEAIEKSRVRLVVVVAWTMVFGGCYNDIDFSKELNPCATCRDCEVCVDKNTSPQCVPVEENVYAACAEDGNIYSFDSCDEFAGAPLVECPAGQGECVEISSSEAECQCLNHWEGEDCSDCPGNWSANKNCADCKTHWDPEKGCEECLGNWDEDENCEVCENHWIDNDDDCDTCPGNWDAEKECNECLGNWDSAENCAECLNGWTGENCEICPEGWEADQDCIEVCGNGQITASEECDDSNDIQLDGCNECKIVEFQVNTYTQLSQKNPAAAVEADGRLVIVWQSSDQDGSDYGIYGQRFDADGHPDGLEFMVNSQTSNNQIGPSVEMASDGRFAVVWSSDEQVGDRYHIYCRRFGSAGVPNGDAFQVNSSTDSSQENPSIAMAPDGRFVVTWQGADADSNGIFAKSYDASGIPSGDEFQVNTFSDSSQAYPAVAMDELGRFTVVWQSDDQDGDSGGIYGRRFDADGNPLAEEFRVNTQISNSQERPAIATAEGGSCIVAWQSEDQNGESLGIFGRRYDVDGSPIGEDFQVNTLANGEYSTVSSAMAGDGRFAIVWRRDYQFGVDGLFVRFFDSDGLPAASEFNVETNTGDSTNPAVTMDEDGRFVLAWEGDDDSFLGIFGQRWDADGNPLGSLPW